MTANLWLIALVAAAGSSSPTHGVAHLAPDAAVCGPETGEAFRGDGRSVVPLPAAGGHAARTFTLSCEGAATLYRGAQCVSFVLPSAADEPRALQCTVTDEGGEHKFRATIVPPKEGLYASFSLPQVVAGTPQVALKPFRMALDGSHSRPTTVRAAASSGSLSPDADGGFILSLPEDRAPRVVSVALFDGVLPGAAFLPVTGQTKLPVTVERQAHVTVRVCGRVFGPFATPTGRVVVPIDVPVGVTSAMLSATDQPGNRRDTLVDLHPPTRPRLAAVAARDQIEVGATMVLVVALASSEGLPSPAESRIRALTSRGTVGASQASGPGLWTIRYEAPQRPGTDGVTIDVEGEPTAGTQTLSFTVLSGPPAQIELEVPKGPFRPGALLQGRGRVRDSRGNLLAAVPAATLDGAPVSTHANDGGFVYSVALPREPSGQGGLSLVVTAGQAETRLPIVVEAEGGLALGAYASLGWATNASRSISSPHATIGAAVRRDAKGAELGLLAGLEYTAATISGKARLGDRQIEAASTVDAYEIPVTARARLVVLPSIGVAVGLALVPTWVSSSSQVLGQPPEKASRIALGLRGTLAADAGLGPGRIVLMLAGGRIQLPAGSVRGPLEHFGVCLGYEWWLWTSGT